MSDAAAGLARVNERIAAACAKAGRAPGSVQLIAVSKLQPASAIRAAWEAGHRHFGENYAQELRDKADELSPILAGLRWHAIGPLQTNKAKYVAKSAHWFHALDRIEIARELSKRRTGTPLKCFLEIHLGDEATKSGVRPEGARALLDQVRALPQLEVVGLMTLPPQHEDPERVRPFFRQLRSLATELSLPELSIGTTSDYELAIEEGATFVRVGTAIFGARPG